MHLMAPLLILAALARFASTDALLFGQPPRRHLLSYRDVWTHPAAILEKHVPGGSSYFERSKYHHNRRATTDDTTTWSKRAPGRSRTESRLGVRRRVRAVLAKARERTGVANDSERVMTSARSSLLGADSNLSLEATTRSNMWSIRNGKSADDFLDSDATLSLLLADEDFTSSPPPGVFASTSPSFSPSSLTSYAVTPTNGKNLSESSIKTTSSNNGYKAPAAPHVRSQQGATSASIASKLPAVTTGPASVLKAKESETQPLPFKLPMLTPEQEAMLKAGERVQEQEKMGGEGSGFVVFDIPAPEYAIWEVLLDFESYPENIGTVRSMRMFTNKHLKQPFFSEKPLPPGATGVRHYGKASISRASFVLSKFRFNIAAIHRYQPHPDGHFMVFTLDPACKNVVLRDAKGIWYTESNPVGAKKGTTRVWLLCELKVSSLLPKFIVDYTAERAMPRATTWLPPAVQRYLKGQKPMQEHSNQE
ncbi:hypothetical protein ACA910_008168 [Epithemia clementina (nom. ined.)]